MLQNKIAVVTGGTRGIGYAIVQKFLQNGAKVVLFGSREETVVKAVASLKEENPDWDVSGAWPKLTDAAAMADEIAKIKEKYGRIDILVNNAGGYPKEIYKNIEHQAIKIWEWSEEQWDQIIKTNLRIPFLVTKNVVPVMIKQEKGDIVNVSSRMGRIASQMGAYAVAKGGIVTMTKTTAIQTKEYGIKSNPVSTGNLNTPENRDNNHTVGQHA